MSEAYAGRQWDVECENNDLRLENAKLREERDHWHVEQVHAFGNWEDSHKRAVELEAENAKLRELVHMMLRVAGIAEYATDAEWQVIARHLSKLGIEVEG